MTSRRRLPLIAALLLSVAGAPALAAAPVTAPADDPPIAGAAAPGAAGDPAATGRVASLELRAAAQRLVAPTFEPPGERAILELPVSPRQSPDAAGDDDAATEDDGFELRTEAVAGSLRQCRIEVARRRGVRLADVGVGLVRLRWTVQPTGDVQNAEVVAAVGTDLTVAACVKRVVAMRSFLPRRESATVERTYSLR
jgi:hypothetical protein